MLSPNENRWDELIVGPAAAENLEPAIVKAIIWNESGFRWPVEDRVERAHALPANDPNGPFDASVGPMQILTQTAAWFAGGWVAKDTLREPATNILLGTQILSAYLNGWRPGDPGVGRIYGVRAFTLEEAFAAYNGGEGVLRHRDAAGRFPRAPFDVQGYVDRAKRAYTYFAGLEARPPTTASSEPSSSDTPDTTPPASSSSSGGGLLIGLVLLGLVVAGGGAAAIFGGRS
jgi:Transglycosylase SLT domain